MTMNFLQKNKTTILYGLSLAFLLYFLRWLELRVVIINNAFEIYAGIVAVLFTGLGIWLAIKLTRPKIETRIIEKEIYRSNDGDFVLNQPAFEQSGLSRRELEVLELMAGGLSNQEIADTLFVSLNTIKTHTSSLFEKMEVKRRTQAIEAGKRQGLIP
jgi:NarL family two-component system response regulator LiaR